MPTRELLIFIGLSLVAAGIVLGAVTIYKQSHHRADVSVPAIRVETDKPSGAAKVDVPFVRVQEGKDLTKDAPPGSKSPAN